MPLRKLIILTITVLLVLACGIAAPKSTKEIEWRCGSLPETFQESNLIGIWQVARKIGVSSERIILREDGTYKQVYEKPNGSRYESPWNAWWIEHRPSGGIYVHLEGMRYCNSTDEECARPEGGGGEWLFYDFCEDRVLRMREEVILAVARDEPHSLLGTASRGIILMHMKPDPDRGNNWFTLEE
jgi:hypothetical protein